MPFVQKFKKQLIVAVAAFFIASVASMTLGANAAPTTTELVPDGSGNVTITELGHYVNTDGDSFRKVTISSSDVTLDGLNFAGGAAVAVRNGVAGLENTVVSNNTIEQAGNNATAVAVFDTDGVVVSGNNVTFVDETVGRRGINSDGNNNVVISNNLLYISDNSTGTSPSSWAIQLSMSDSVVSDVVIQNNTISGSYFGIVGLSQRNLSNLRINANDITAFVGLAFNSGGVTPIEATLINSNIAIHGNKLSVRIGVYLRSLHTPTKTVEFSNVRISGNSVRALSDGATVEAVRIDPENANFILDSVFTRRNNLRKN